MGDIHVGKVIIWQDVFTSDIYSSLSFPNKGKHIFKEEVASLKPPRDKTVAAHYNRGRVCSPIHLLCLRDSHTTDLESGVHMPLATIHIYLVVPYETLLIDAFPPKPAREAEKKNKLVVF